MSLEKRQIQQCGDKIFDARDAPVFYRTFGATSTKVNEERRSVSVVASTEAIDGHGEIVEQVWDLSRYSSNPIVLWNHSAGGLFSEAALPLGKAENVRVENAGTSEARLEADLVFASEIANPLAERVFNLYKEKVLRAVSVGFRPGSIRYEEIDGREVEILSKNVLLEISATPIGANPEALAKCLNAEKEYCAHLKDSQPPFERGGETESNMDIEKQIEDLNREKAALEKKNSELSEKQEKLEARCQALTERCDSLEKARTEMQEKADKLTEELTDRDLSGLVGIKIMPAEKTGLVRLAAIDRELYEDQLTAIKARPDMVHLKRVIQDAPQPIPVKQSQDDHGASLHEAASALANG
jgi:HK97 family phage prohead protease